MDKVVEIPPHLLPENQQQEHYFAGDNGRAIEATSHGETAMADIALGKQVIECLEKHYPGHNWYVEANHLGGVVTIQLCYPTKGGKIRVWNHGMVLHIKNLDTPDRLNKKVMLSGGELLERGNLARKGANPYTAFEARENGLDTSNMVQ